jgi:hypothetical protein
MQDRQINPSDDTQRWLPFSDLYQNKPTYGISSQATPSASSDVSYSSIENLYIFREANEVRSFLKENPFLIPLLQEARMHIKRYFPDSDVVLEVVTDPEIMGEKDLVAFIVVELTADEACDILDRLDEEWWLDASDRAQDLLCITLEYK